jgi:hypothetical protein
MSVDMVVRPLAQGVARFGVGVFFRLSERMNDVFGRGNQAIHVVRDCAANIFVGALDQGPRFGDVILVGGALIMIGRSSKR